MASLFGAKNNGAKAQLAATSKVAHSTIAGHSVAIVAGLFIMALLKFFNFKEKYTEQSEQQINNLKMQ